MSNNCTQREAGLLPAMGIRSGQDSQDPSLPATEAPDFRHLDLIFGPRNLARLSTKTFKSSEWRLRYKWSCETNVQDRARKLNGLAMLCLTVIYIYTWFWMVLKASRWSETRSTVLIWHVILYDQSKSIAYLYHLYHARYDVTMLLFESFRVFYKLLSDKFRPKVCQFLDSSSADFSIQGGTLQAAGGSQFDRHIRLTLSFH